MLNVKDFKALGNGVKDDTEAIQNCINEAASQNGNKIYFPKGQYVITSTIVIQSEGIELVGDGQLASQILSFVSKNHAIQFQAPANTPQQNIYNCGIRHLGVTQMLNNTEANAFLVFAKYVCEFHADNLRLYGANGPSGNFAQGLIFLQGTSVYLSNIDAIGAQANGIKCYAEYISYDGKSILYGNDYMLSDITVQMNGNQGRALNIIDVTEGAVEAINCNFLSGNNCEISNTSCAVFTNCYFDSAQYPVAVSTNCNHVYFNSCEFANRPGGGLTVDNSDNIRINNSMIINNGSSGIEVLSGSGFCLTNSTIDANCTEISAPNPNGDAGVNIGPGVCDFQIIGNRIGNYTAGFGGKQQIGIAVNAGMSDRYIIANNIVTQNLNVQIADNGMGTNKIVTNNVT